MHEYIRNEISKKVGEDIGNKIRIMCGEYIDENNWNELIVLKNVDGFLVGRISTKNTFNNIIECAKHKE